VALDRGLDGWPGGARQVMSRTLRRAMAAAALVAVVIMVVSLLQAATFAYAVTPAATTWGPATQVPAQMRVNYPSVSCSTKDSCVALDLSGNASVLTGGGWSTPVATGLDFRSANWAPQVSCTSSTFCLAVDASRYSTFDGTSWSAAQAVNPNETIKSAYHRYQAVSCATATFCVAVTDDSYSAIFLGGSWRTNVLIDKADLDVSGASGFYAVSCPTTTFCAAGDSYGNTFIFNGLTWAAHRAPTGVSGQGQMSCPDITLCLGEQSIGTPPALQLWDGGGWTVTSPPPYYSRAGGVQCLAARYCLTVSGSTDHLATPYVLDGTGWTSLTSTGWATAY
jgi:hypothetical protein